MPTRPTGPRGIQSPHPGPGGRTAFTLVELMIALTITAMVAACIAIMVNSVAAGTIGAQDGRRHLVRMQSLESRLLGTVHSASCILAAGNAYIVYWTGDANCDNNLQLSELGLLELDNTNTLQQYHTVFPANFSLAQIASANTTYATNTNWYAAAQTAKSTGYFPATAVARNITTFNVTLDNVTPTAALLATFTVQLSDGQVTRSGMIAAAIRTLQVPQ